MLRFDVPEVENGEGWGPHFYFQFSFILLSMLGLHKIVEADYLTYSCQNEYGNHSTNSTFESNLKLLLDSLPYNTATMGFNNTTVGEGPNRVYGQALCRGDATSTACESCVSNASQEIMKLCNAKDAIISYELCQVRYSFQDFFSNMVYTGKYPDSNSQEKLASDPARFYKYLMYLMNNISNEAAYVKSTQMFVMGQINYSVSQTIYGLVQCTRDMSDMDCNSCLNSALGDLKACCYTREGGTVVSRTCNVRYELYRFFNGSTTSMLSYPASTGDKWKKGMIGLVVGILGLLLAVLAGSCAVYFNRKKAKQDLERSPRALLHDLINPVGVEITEDGNLVSSEELPFMDLATLKASTDDFSSSNKLGQGGFGTVYKGVLSDGKEVAVKRLSRKSWQGLEEFKNEVILIAKLQHRNLVRLLGCGIEGDEKLLVYEFMPNKSLDIYIFDSDKRAQLDWCTCISIINGIARGLVYLHEDSRLRIIHRDLKPSNVLLDHEMVAKISDFGMARIFCENQSSANTRRVVGTYGYMAPEYAMGGLFSVKSDVFSFGVILLEIICGKRNSGFYLTEHAQTLLAYAWTLWTEGRELELVDPSLAESGSIAEIARCIHIGLLCVQEDPGDRPTMSEVVTLLGGQTGTLPEPKKPAFSVGRVVQELDQSSATNISVNQKTVSSISPR
ncbi:cysteine-rich receptor-like protein kinase 15 isoform X1 [Syzygium oleosum]|uniref:cysteine-rich receptor-like protein kinase 15 isoform X1 n=2 Tax=Syzygium oleosum TaxID=219896 RepID=UPI0024B9D65D|nr:cysteine-rich receptor-like protein kinase 15 isoform X1 [Syzygium oleosum]